MSNSVAINSISESWSRIKAEQGFIGKVWNGIKEITNLGQSASDCESMLEKYKNHEISLEEAMNYIEEFEKKQGDMTNLIANIATGIASIALATTYVGVGVKITWPLAVKYGAPIGAAVKALLKGTDRATNKIKGDTLDGKEIFRDLSSGAVTGTVSAVSSGVYAGVKEASLAKSIINGTECGLACGSLSGSSNYLIDTMLDEDKKFNFGDLTKTTATSAFVSGTVGAVVGGGIYGIENLAGNVGKNIELSASKTIARDSATSSSRKILGTVERNIIHA